MPRALWLKTIHRIVFLTPKPSRVRIRLFHIMKKAVTTKVVTAFIGWGIGIRTPTNRVRVCRATVTLFPNEQEQLYINVFLLSRVFYKIFYDFFNYSPFISFSVSSIPSAIAFAYFSMFSSYALLSFSFEIKPISARTDVILVCRFM